MASVSKNPIIQKSGDRIFKIQVKYRNPRTGLIDTKTRNFRPFNQGTSKRQIELNRDEAKRIAAQYEAEIKLLYGGFDVEDRLTPESTFEEVARKWINNLECRCKKSDCSYSHLSSSERRVEICIEYLGKTKVQLITPEIVGWCFEQLDKRQRTVRTIRSKPEKVREVMKQRGETYTTLTMKHKLNNDTICAVLNGKKNVSYDYAKRVSEALGVDVNSLFDITEKVVSYAPYTIYHLKNTVKAVLSYAQDKHIVLTNSAKSIKNKKKKGKKIKSLSEAQVNAVFETLKEHGDIRQKTIMYTLILTGMRRGEICGLKWDAIDLDNGQITVENNITRAGKYGKQEKDPKTEKSTRTICVPKILIRQLKKYKEWYDAEKHKMGSRWNNDGYVFININNCKPISPDTINTWVNKITESAGVGRRTVHSLRHTNVSMKLMAGIPLFVVSREAGHNNYKTTVDIYGHLTPDDSKSPMLLDKKFGWIWENGKLSGGIIK